MPMLAEFVDAVVGVDTHRDTHQVEIALPNGALIATCSISNDTSAGYAAAAGLDRRARPRAAAGGLASRAPAATASGWPARPPRPGWSVIECEQPTRKTRRGKGKSDPIDAHLAVLTALRLDADRLPTPRADGDREALRILLGARQRADHHHHRADQPAARPAARRRRPRP